VEAVKEEPPLSYDDAAGLGVALVGAAMIGSVVWYVRKKRREAALAVVPMPPPMLGQDFEWGGAGGAGGAGDPMVGIGPGYAGGVSALPLRQIYGGDSVQVESS
jgi:hypothetical protein